MAASTSIHAVTQSDPVAALLSVLRASDGCVNLAAENFDDAKVVYLAHALIAHAAEVLAHHCISSKFNDSYFYLFAVFCISQSNYSPLEEINLGDNRIGDAGIEELARRLGTVRKPSLHNENVSSLSPRHVAVLVESAHEFA
jgi:hypothetical protein